MPYEHERRGDQDNQCGWEKEENRESAIIKLMYNQEGSKVWFSLVTG
jgi:hypothetical protein